MQVHSEKIVTVQVKRCADLALNDIALIALVAQ